MAEFPSYVIRPHILRIVLPEFLLVLFLAGIFYAGIAINIYLLGISIPPTVGILIAVTLGLLSLTQSLLTYVRTAKLQYLIYQNRIQVEGGKEGYVMFNSVQDVQTKKSFFDSLFNTGTVIVGPNIQLIGITNFDQTVAYIRQMIQYARNNP